MVKVAVAGGTGGIGRHIVEGILETKKHDVIVLSRSSSYPELEALGVKIVPVSYDDPTSLTSALAGVHTVISTISGINEESMTKPQLALLAAAVKAGVKRFVPSEFGAHVTPDSAVELYRYKWAVAEAVRKSGLEYTLFENGLLMNYLVAGTAGIGYLRPRAFIWDVENCKATIPGDGSAYVVMTRAEDVGKFVAASLDLEKWTEVSRIQGDRKTLNEVLKLAEEARGKTFNVTYIPKEQVEIILANDRTEGFSLTKFAMHTFLNIITGDSMGYTDANLNDACPQVRPMGAEELLKKWWSKE